MGLIAPALALGSSALRAGALRGITSGIQAFGKSEIIGLLGRAALAKEVLGFAEGAFAKKKKPRKKKKTRRVKRRKRRR